MQQWAYVFRQSNEDAEGAYDLFRKVQGFFANLVPGQKNPMLFGSLGPTEYERVMNLKPEEKIKSILNLYQKLSNDPTKRFQLGQTFWTL